MDIALDEVLHFDVITSNPATGAVSDADSTPTWDIFEEDTDTAILSAQNFTKRTSKTGNYRGAATLSAGNGFEVGKWYNVVASATVNSIAGKAVVMRFRVCPAEAVAGVPKVDTLYFAGQTITCGGSVTIPAATLASTTNITTAAGCAVTSIATDAVSAAAVSAAAVTKIQSGLSTHSAADVWAVGTRTLSAFSFSVTVGTNNDKTGYALSVTPPTAAQVATAVEAAILDEGDATALLAAIAAKVETFVINDGDASATLAAMAAAVWANASRTLTAATNLAIPSAADNSTAVWNAGTRVLTAGTNIALAKGTGVTGFNDLSAAQVNAEVDSALADYDAPTRTEATSDKQEILTAVGEGGGGGGETSVEIDSFSNEALEQLSAVTRVVVFSPHPSFGRLNLVQGDDYLDADGRALRFTNEAGSWPNLDEGDIVLRLSYRGTSYDTDPGDVVTATGPNQDVKIDLPSAISAMLIATDFTYQLILTDDDDHQITLEHGKACVTLRLPAPDDA